MSRPDLIAEPGIYDLPAAVYHADPCPEPSLSASIARLLVDETPRHAWTAHPRLNPAAESRSTPAMDLGSVAHELVLGKGGGYVESPYDEYRTKEAKAWKAEQIAAGLIPIKPDDLKAAEIIAAKVGQVARDVLGRNVFDDGIAGWSEPVIAWREGGAWCRAMLDRLIAGGRADIFDLKTTGSGLSDRAIQARLDGLDLQAAFHLRGIERLFPEYAGRTHWHWIFAEVEPPYEVRVVALDGATREMGRRKMSHALALWDRCRATGEWPGYPREVVRLDYPTWAEQRWMAREEAGAVLQAPSLAPAPLPSRKRELLGAC